MLDGQFELPVSIDLAAAFVFGLTGALAALKRGYDCIGLLALAIATALGGGLIRDGIFISQGPPAAAKDSRYILVIVASAAFGYLFKQRVFRFNKVIAWLDALGLGAYAVVGVQKALNAELSVAAAILVGVINAAGGGILRDVIARGRITVEQWVDVITTAHALGIRNVFVIMGDPTAIGDYPEAMDNYDLVPSGLIKLIKQGFNVGVDHSGTSIGQPTNFFVGAALNLCPPDMENEVKNLRRKVRAGADFFLTQPIYVADDAHRLLEAYEARYGKLEKPILVGILPLVSARHTSFLHHEVPGIFIPQSARDRIEAAGENAAQVGVELAVELVQSLKAWAGGIYMMPQFNRYDMIAEIIESVK